jgi:hypothetical protein
MDNRVTIVLLALLIRSPSYAISPSCPTSADGLQRKPSLGAVPGRDSQHCGGMNAGSAGAFMFAEPDCLTASRAS